MAGICDRLRQLASHLAPVDTDRPLAGPAARATTCSTYTPAHSSMLPPAASSNMVDPARAAKPGRLLHFPHCGEKRQVGSPPWSLLDQLPGHWYENGGDRHAGAYVLCGPEMDAPTPAPRWPATLTPGREAAQESGGGATVSEGLLALVEPSAGESVASMARRLEDDGLLYLPNVLNQAQVARLRAAMDRTETDRRNPVDSGIGTLGHENARAAGTLGCPLRRRRRPSAAVGARRGHSWLRLQVRQG